MSIINFPDCTLKSHQTPEKVHFAVQINVGWCVKGAQISQV